MIVFGTFYGQFENLSVLSDFKPSLYHEYLDNLDLEELAENFVESRQHIFQKSL